MSMSRILGAVLFVVGLVLLIFAWNASHAAADTVVAATTGKFTQSTMAYLIIGLASLIGGGALWLGGRPKP